MPSENDCSLSDTYRELLQTCITLRTTHAKMLARALNRSPQTIQTEFRRLFEKLGVHSREEAVLLAIDRGWVSLPSKPPAQDDSPPE